MSMLMRVSPAFNKLASVPLYRHVICDDLPLLTSHLDDAPAHPLIPSKAQLLKRIRYLHLEYSCKTEGVTYLDIMLNKHHLPRIDEQPTGLDTLERHAQFELEQLSSCLGRLAPHETVFSGLVTLSVASIFGHQHGLWQRVINNDVGDHLWTHMQSCSNNMKPAFRAPTLTGWCQRGSYGPYALPPAITWVDRISPSPLLTVHIDEQTLFAPVVVGERTRWVLEQYINEELMPMASLLCFTIIDAVRAIIKSGGVENAAWVEPRLNVIIYASGRRAAPDREPVTMSNIRVLSKRQEREETERVVSKLAVSHGKNVQWGASWQKLYKIGALPDAPPCMCCYWAYEANEAQGAEEYTQGGGCWLEKWLYRDQGLET